MLLEYYSNSFSTIRFPKIRNGYSLLNFSPPQLFHSAITVGRKDRWDVRKHGQYSVFEMVYRKAMLQANLFQNNSRFLEKSIAYASLDPSEKSAVSYYLAMTMTSLLSKTMLGIPYIMHLEVYEKYIHNNFGLHYNIGKSRPDFIAMDKSGNWYVFESKGRTGGFDPVALQKAKSQTKMIKSIGGKTPVARIATESFFKKNILRVHWEDPESDTETEYLELDGIRPVDFIQNYYRPFHDLIDDNQISKVGNAENFVVNVGQIGLSLRIPRSIERIYQLGAQDNQQLNVILQEISDIGIVENENEFTFRGEDGITVEIDKQWATEFRKQ